MKNLKRLINIILNILLIVFCLNKKRKIDIGKVNEIKIFNFFEKDILSTLWDSYQNHNFDLLGSGFKNSGYDVVPLCFRGVRKNDAYAPIRKKGQIELSPSFSCINWQRDIKSGYCWDIKSLSRIIQIQGKPKADIIVVWELARVQYLPRLLLISIQEKELRPLIEQEFKDIIADFYLNNPVGFGANWYSPMDVAIRLCNVVLSSILYEKIETIKDENFKKLLSKFIGEHHEFLIRSYKLMKGNPNNHHLACLCGILFTFAFTLSKRRKDESYIINYSRELLFQINKQFNKDGTNVEGSTSYHLLSTELAFFGLLSICKLEIESTFSDELTHAWGIIMRAEKFIHDFTKPNGKITQIGDNDSGCLFRLTPRGKLITFGKAHELYLNHDKNVEDSSKPYWDEDLLQSANILDYFSAMHNPSDNHSLSIEKVIVRMLFGEVFDIFKNIETQTKCHLNNNLSIQTDITAEVELQYKKEYIINISKHESGVFQVYPDFGYVVYKTKSLFISLYYGNNNFYGVGVHNHNDKLSVEVYDSGKTIFYDPGTFVYTSIPEKRDLYRSIKAHNTINVNGLEQNKLISCFKMSKDARSNLLLCDKDLIIAKCEYLGVIHIRMIKVEDEMLVSSSVRNF